MIYNNIVSKDITMSGNPVPSLVKSKLANVTFDHVILNGEPLTNDRELPRRQGIKIENPKYIVDE